MTWQDRITIDPEVLVGKPVIKGTVVSDNRVRVVPLPASAQT